MFLSTAGCLDESLHTEVSCRHGCPLSPILYVLVAETLGGLVRASPLAGLPFPGSDDRSKISQYADDTAVVVMCNADFDIWTIVWPATSSVAGRSSTWISLGTILRTLDGTHRRSTVGFVDGGPP